MLAGSLTYVYSVWRQCVKSSPPPPPHSLGALQLQTTWEKGRAIYIFKNGSGMKLIGTAESVNKCDTKRKKKSVMIPGIC